MSRRKKRKSCLQRQQSPSAYLAEASSTLKHGGNTQIVLEFATKVLELSRDPKETEPAREILAEAHFQLSFDSHTAEDRLQHLNTALDITPDDPRLRFYQGIALLEIGRYTDALNAFQTVARTEPGREGLAYFRNLALLGAGKAIKSTHSLSEKEAQTLDYVKAFWNTNTQPPSDGANTLPGITPRMWQTLLAMQRDPADATQKLAVGSGQPALDPIFRYYQGVAAMRQGNPEQAVKLWDQAMVEGFSAPWAEQNLHASLQKRFYALAEEGRWDEIMTAGQTRSGELEDQTLKTILSIAGYRRGYEFAQKSDWRKAAQAWREAAEQVNTRYLAQNLALAEEQLEHWEQAAKAWRDVLKRRPRSKKHPDALTDKQVAMLWDHVSECYGRAENWKEEKDCLKKAIKYAPDNLDLRFKLVDIYLDERQESQVEKELKAILEQAPENMQALSRLADFYKQFPWRADGPLPVWKQMLAIEPQNFEAREAIADYYVEQVRPEQVANPSFFTMIMGPRRQKPKQKIKMLQEGLELLPDHPRLLAMLGNLYHETKQPQKAVETLLKAYHIAPQNPQTIGLVLHGLLHAGAGSELETLIPEVHHIPGMRFQFWVDQAVSAFECHLEEKWAIRFLDEAIAHLQYEPQTSKAGILANICITIAEAAPNHVKNEFRERVRQEVPRSGAVELVNAFRAFTEQQNVKKAQKLLRKARKMADKAGDASLLREIELAEKMITINPLDLLGDLARMVGLDPTELDDFMDEYESFI
jgi:tetratricopeptide (TPR) repeat protein